VKLRRDPDCPLCGGTPTIKDLSIHMNSGGACEASPNGHGEPAATGTPTARASG
jgi:hypothetical protein